MKIRKSIKGTVKYILHSREVRERESKAKAKKQRERERETERVEIA